MQSISERKKDILYRELCERLPYDIRCFVPVYDEIMTLTGKRLNYFCFHRDEFGLDYRHEIEVVLDPYNSDNIIKPYLRPTSSMTKEEIHELDMLFKNAGYEEGYEFILNETTWIIYHDFMLAHHFDYRGLIEMGLALKAPEDMYEE